MVWMSNNEMYVKISRILHDNQINIIRYLMETQIMINNQNQDTNEYKEWLSDIANRLEAALANEKEKQVLKLRIEELEGEHRELEEEHRELQEQYKWLMKEICNLIEEILKKGD